MPRKGAGSLSLSELESLIRSRREKISKLNKQREKIAKKLAKIDADIAAAGGTVSSGAVTRGGRAKNAKSLNSVLLDVLKGKSSMRVGDIADAVLATGYRTTSDNFRGIVNQTLIKDKNFVKAGERGMYALKK